MLQCMDVEGRDFMFILWFLHVSKLLKCELCKGLA